MVASIEGIENFRIFFPSFLIRFLRIVDIFLYRFSSILPLCVSFFFFFFNNRILHHIAKREFFREILHWKEFENKGKKEKKN